HGLAPGCVVCGLLACACWFLGRAVYPISARRSTPMPYIDTDRVSLFYEDAGSGGVPALLLHELGGSSESWRGVIPLLAADRRGNGLDVRSAGRPRKTTG